MQSSCRTLIPQILLKGVYILNINQVQSPTDSTKSTKRIISALTTPKPKTQNHQPISSHNSNKPKMRFPTTHSPITYLTIIILTSTFQVLAVPRPDVTFEGTLTLSYQDMPKTSTASATPTAIDLLQGMHQCATGRKGTPPFCR